jgi:hypothetical protein
MRVGSGASNLPEDNPAGLLLLRRRHLLSLILPGVLLAFVLFSRILVHIRLALRFIPLASPLLLPVFIRPLRFLLRRLRVFFFGLRFHIGHKSPFGLSLVDWPDSQGKVLVY